MRIFNSLIFLLTLLPALTAEQPATWPQFRGPGGLGIMEEGGPGPIHFGPGSNEVWSVTLPPGNSSPCLAGERLFLTGLNDGRLETLCLHRRTGQILWRRAAPAAPLEATHRLANPATPTPATNGKVLFVYFGSYGLLAYDLDGVELWRKPLPVPQVEFGTGTSPILFEDLLLLNCDQDQNSHLLALRVADGSEVYRLDRSQFRRGFATPFLWSQSGGTELIVPGSIWLKGYDPRSGRELWSFTGTSRVACSSPAAEGDLLISASWNVGGDSDSRITMPPFAEYSREYDKNKDHQLTREEMPAGPVRDRFAQMDLNKDNEVTETEWQLMSDMFTKASNAVLAIKAGGRGDITGSHLAWKVTRSLPYVSSPLCYKGRVFTVKNGGLISCYEAKTGQPIYQDERLEVPGDYYASAVAGRDQVYLASQSGTVIVLAAQSDQLKVLARNRLSDPIMATPALVDGALYVRTETRLYCFTRAGKGP